MRTMFVTYKEGNIVKKGKLSEDRFTQLQNSGKITEVQVYPNEKLMEQTYGQLLCSDKGCSNKNFLLG